jgi:D-serine deaminase-like pyridoxal phosphate-dependent protein
MSSIELYPTSPRDALAQYIGKSIRDVPTPAAVINVAAIRRNCERMLHTCDKLGLDWRAHVKTHKVRGIFCLTNFHVLTLSCADCRDY